MTVYATADQFETQFGVEELLIASDREGDGDTDTDVITSALLTASQEIDSYISTRYSLPLASVPDILIRICGDVAMFRLSTTSHAMTEEKERRYTQAVAWLKDVARGTASLTLPSSGGSTEQAPQDLPEMSSETQARQFSRTKMWGLW